MNENTVWLTDTSNINPIPVGDPLTQNRDESWRWAMHSVTEAPLGDLEGAGTATLEFNVNSTIRGGGNFVWSGIGDPPEWSKLRLQPWYVLKIPGGEITWPLGMFIPAAPSMSYSDTGHTTSVELYDKLLIMERDCVETTYTVPAGALVTDEIRAVIASTGETLMVIEASTQTLKSPMVWEAGETKLRIVNDLLKALNYFSLWCDGYGAYRAEPYNSPQSRPVVRTFTDDEESIYAPDFTHNMDTFNVPNKVIQIGRSDGDTPALVGVATDTDPDSPFSQPSIGSWLTHIDSDVEATSQAVLDTIAARRLRELQQVSSAFEISHALVPIDLNDVVRFQQSPNNIDVLAVVQTMSISTTAGELVKTNLKQVVS